MKKISHGKYHLLFLIQFKGAFLILLGLNLLVYCPFFMSGQTFGFSMDTFDYLAFAERVSLGRIPVENLPIDLPIGYPLILALFNNIGVEILILFQVILFFVSSVLLLREAFKSNWRIGMAVFIGMVFFSILPMTIKHTLSLNPEGMFTISLMLVVSSLLYFVRKGNLRSIIFLVCSFLFCVLLRSNGFLLFPVFLILLYKKNKLLRNITVLSLGILLNMSANYHFKNEFSFGDWKRIEKVIGKVFNKTKNKKVNEEKRLTKYEMYNWYLGSYFAEQPSFYFSLIQTNQIKHEKYSINGFFVDKCFDNELVISDVSSTFEMYAKEFILNGDELSYSKFDLNEKLTIPMISHLIYKVFFYLSIYPILFIFFVILLFRLIRQFILNYRDIKNFTFLIILLFVITMIILLPFMNARPQLRYLQVFNFIVYASGVYQVLTMVLNFKKKSLKD